MSVLDRYVPTDEMTLLESCHVCWIEETDGFADCVACGYPTCSDCLTHADNGAFCDECVELGR